MMLLPFLVTSIACRRRRVQVRHYQSDDCRALEKKILTQVAVSLQLLNVPATLTALANFAQTRNPTPPT